jgi:hypothetical protein
MKAAKLTTSPPSSFTAALLEEPPARPLTENELRDVNPLQ